MTQPTFHPVADMGVVIRFGDKIDPEIHNKVIAMDQAVQDAGIDGILETIPSYSALFIGYDPLVTSYDDVAKKLGKVHATKNYQDAAPEVWDIPVCYDRELAPDLTELALMSGQSEEEVINIHLSGDYLLYMYGFAPGYGYLGGVPDQLQYPRKPDPVRNVPAGSVIVAGPQCLITTLTLPTGWWRIGKSPYSMFRPQDENPFPIAVGDHIRFRRIDRNEFDELSNASAVS